MIEKSWFSIRDDFTQVRRKVNGTQEEFHVVYATLGKEPVTIQVRTYKTRPVVYRYGIYSEKIQLGPVPTSGNYKQQVLWTGVPTRVSVLYPIGLSTERIR